MATTQPGAPTDALHPGVIAGVTLKKVGSQTVKSSNAVLSNLRIAGDLTIDAPASNVMIDNVQVDGAVHVNTDTPSTTKSGGRVGIVPINVTLRHVDAHGLDSLGFDGLQIEFSHFHDKAGTISQLSRYSHAGLDWPATQLTIKNSVFDHIHAVGPNSETHLEALHLMGVTDFTLSSDVFDASVPDQTTWAHVTAALTLEKAYEDVANSGTIVDCRFRGGGYYQTYLWGATAVNDNDFSTYLSPDGSHRSSPMYPPSAYAPARFPAFTQSGNTLDGKPYVLPTK